MTCIAQFIHYGNKMHVKNHLKITQNTTVHVNYLILVFFNASLLIKKPPNGTMVGQLKDTTEVLQILSTCISDSRSTTGR